MLGLLNYAKNHASTGVLLILIVPRSLVRLLIVVYQPLTLPLYCTRHVSDHKSSEVWSKIRKKTAVINVLNLNIFFY